MVARNGTDSTPLSCQPLHTILYFRRNVWEYFSSPKHGVFSEHKMKPDAETKAWPFLTEVKPAESSGFCSSPVYHDHPGTHCLSKQRRVFRVQWRPEDKSLRVELFGRYPRYLPSTFSW